MNGRWAIGIVLALTGCSPPPPSSESTWNGLSDATASIGVGFVHGNGALGGFRFPEIMGSGAALMDYDQDGDLDLFLVQFHGAPRQGTGDRLYRNDWIPKGRLEFVDVTSVSGLEGGDEGMGVAVGDYDNDGWPDLLVTRVGANRLWRNLSPASDGPWFVDVAAQVGVADASWSTGATFFDADRDGWLDLFVANYVEYSPDREKQCRTDSGGLDYCSPKSYSPAQDRFYRNEGPSDGEGSTRTIRFRDATESAGFLPLARNGLGVAAIDVDADGWLDLYVANDEQPNSLWRNQGDGRFVEEGLLSGSALNQRGDAEASMGVALGDFDRDGDRDLFLTHLDGETNTMFENLGGGLFVDVTDRVRLSATSLDRTGFGTALDDLNLDGLLDLLVVNGAVTIEESQVRSGSKRPFEQRSQIFLQADGASFVPANSPLGGFDEPEVGRGLAVGDLDNDGDSDLVVTHNGGATRIYTNRLDPIEFLGLEVKTVTSSGRARTADGARVRWITAEGTEVWRWAYRDGSYLSSSDPRVVFPSGVLDPPVVLEILWPSGRLERWSEDLATETGYRVVVEGSGRPVLLGDD